MDIIITLVVLLFSVIVHEVMHGVVAGWLGDSTAHDEGRITLNPLPHIDPFGTIALPLLMYVSQASFGIAHPIVFGAAKPVPVDFDRLQPRKLGMILVSLAGPFSNYALAIIALILIRVGVPDLLPGSSVVLGSLAFYNILLGTFNLIPIPPLDGSKVIAAFLPDHLMRQLFSLERYGFVLIFLLLYMGILEKILIPVLNIFSAISGVNL
jgi:Zn-dependent protease